MQVKVSESARDLGVVLDSQLSLSAHVAALCRAGFFHLRQLRPAIRPMTTAAARTAVQAFICCRLDYCNSVVRYVRRPFSEDPVDPERRRTSGHRDSSMRSHHAGASSIALASCSSTSRLQSCMSGAPVASGSDTCIPG